MRNILGIGKKAPYLGGASGGILSSRTAHNNCLYIPPYLPLPNLEPTTSKSQFSAIESIYSGLNLIQLGSLELSMYLELGSLMTKPSHLYTKQSDYAHSV